MLHCGRYRQQVSPMPRSAGGVTHFWMKTRSSSTTQASKSPSFPLPEQVRPHLEDRHTVVSIAAGVTLQSLKVDRVLAASTCVIPRRMQLDAQRAYSAAHVEWVLGCAMLLQR